MPTPTYTPLATKTLTATAASVTFSSISQSYRDLVLVISAKASTSGSRRIDFRFNADTGANYNSLSMEGNGATIASQSSNGNTYFPAAWAYLSINSTEANALVLNLIEYNGNKYKSFLIRSGNSALGVSTMTGKWNSQIAVNSITASVSDSFLFAIGSTFTLYGIAVA